VAARLLARHGEVPGELYRLTGGRLARGGREEPVGARLPGRRRGVGGEERRGLDGARGGLGEERVARRGGISGVRRERPPGERAGIGEREEGGGDLIGARRSGREDAREGGAERRGVGRREPGEAGNEAAVEELGLDLDGVAPVALEEAREEVGLVRREARRRRRQLAPGGLRALPVARLIDLAGDARAEHEPEAGGVEAHLARLPAGGGRGGERRGIEIREDQPQAEEAAGRRAPLAAVAEEEEVRPACLAARRGDGERRRQVVEDARLGVVGEGRRERRGGGRGEEEHQAAPAGTTASGASPAMAVQSVGAPAASPARFATR